MLGRTVRFTTVALTVAGCALAQTSAGAPLFEKDIFPIFIQYCVNCHGKSSPQLGLDLRTAASALRGSHNGPVIVPGSLDKSPLWQKVSTRAMPPEAFGQELPESHIETIRRWIEGGAPSDQPTAVIREEVKAQRARFEKEVLPLFQKRCVQCHGQGEPMAGLDLRTLASLIKGSKNGPVVVDGFSEQSLLVRKVAGRSMPPPGAGEPLTEGEISILREWIDRGYFPDTTETGAPSDRAFTEAENPAVTEKDRQFWAFRKPLAPPVPRVKATRRARTAIDAFVLSKLESKGLTFSPDAPKLTLMRRAYFDLVGLPPTLEEIQSFLNDTKSGAYERLIDRLLDSPRYGERWGRHWLDVVGYVDTSGKDFDPVEFTPAEGIWRYRDYVVKATNEDKPWDRFLTEQIAGDELVDWRAAERYNSEVVELLVATGYMRHVLDSTDPDITNLPSERYAAIFKLVDKLSSGLLGLSVSCGRCHSHKFDPIPQRDYYRFLALFTPAYNPTDWLQPKNRHLYTVSKPDQEEIERHNAEIDQSLTRLEEQLASLHRPYEERLLEQKLVRLPEAIRDDTKMALATEEEKRDDVQKYLVEKFESMLEVTPEEVDKELDEADRATAEKLKAQISTWNGYRRKLEKIQALWDVGSSPKMRLLQRGRLESPGPRVKPGFLTVLSPPGRSDAVRPAATQGNSSGLRLAFAQWLTSQEHPLTARVIVNRIWQHHFGRGLVETPDNFGRAGSPPTHPELLDWLAVDFMQHGWKAKRLHKMIMTSTVYGQLSRQPAEKRVLKAKTADPGNRLLWRMNLRRLEAEVLRDAVIAASGQLEPTMGGPPVMIKAKPDGLQTVSDEEPVNGRWRRSIYLLARRTYPLTFLGVFDYPVIDTNCTRRTPSVTPLQSLTMMNGEFVVESARYLTARANEIAGKDSPLAKKVETTYLLTLSRMPTSSEIKLSEEYLNKQQDLYLKANVAASEASERAFASLAQTLLSTNEFLYVD